MNDYRMPPFHTSTRSIFRSVVRSLVGEADEKERTAVQQWLDRNQSNRQIFQSLENLLREKTPRTDRWDEDELWNAFAAKAQIAAETEIDRQGDPALGVPARRRFFLAPFRWAFGEDRSFPQYAFRIAVLLVLFLTGMAGTAAYFKHLQEERELAYQSTYQEFSTQRGERASIQLGDGTIIHLNSATRLRFPVAFAKTQRDVFLDGEAFFDVAHNDAAPFFVHASDATVRVVGTKFNLTSYSEDKKTRLVVTEGKVAFSGDRPDEAVVLRANQMSRIIKGGMPTREDIAHADRYLAWMRNQLVFENATLAEVITQLSRKFDIEFKIHDPRLLSRHIVAIYDAESFSQIMRSLSLSLHFQYEQQGRVVTVFSR